MTSADLSASGYQATLRELRQRLRLAQIAIFRQNSQAIIVLEGYDAAGKGGVIRELSYAWDPRGFAVHPIGPPSKKEAGHPFLWRFWNRLPAPGQIAIFDRSWYGRLLVEQVEHGLPDGEYETSISEINAFEKMLQDNQITLIKLCLETDAETHRTRLLRRAAEPQKRWKLTVSDIESFAHRADYELAFDAMVSRCAVSPWHRIDTNRKKPGRLAALRAVSDSLEANLTPRTFAYNPGVIERLGELSK